MNARIRKQLRNRKRRIAARIDKAKMPRECPVLSASNVRYEIADRAQAISAGGIGLIHQMVKRLELDREINQELHLLKLYMPYAESDHVLNMAYNLLAGGTCLDHLELRRNDESYLNALGAKRIPDPTTAGDFCRRFSWFSCEILMEVFNRVRRKVWRQQPDEFFEEAIIEADGTMVETGGDCKQGIDYNGHKKQWGYHPLLVTLANTGEPLYIVNRSGSRPSHEHAHAYLDRTVCLCRHAGFRQVRLRGDTDFSQTEHLDRWDDDGVQFIFGIDAMSNLYDLAGEKIEKHEWRPLERKKQVGGKPRKRPENVRARIVEEREFENLKLQQELVGEFTYRPTKCKRDYRIVVVWKDVHAFRGQQWLFDDPRCFFYITNDWESSAEEIVFSANQRCNQENLIEQLKNGPRALTAPLDNLISNWAYMVIASLAWSLKAWASLLLPVQPRWKGKHHREKQTLLRMDFRTFQNAIIQIPAQIIRGARRTTYRLLAWNSWQHVFFRLHDQLTLPLRC